LDNNDPNFYNPFAINSPALANPFEKDLDASTRTIVLDF
jgi:hypothetical protein